MAWVAEILRKDHRICSVCRMGPTHVYDPDPAAPAESPDAAAASGGTPLCNACLAGRLETDMAAFSGRALLFEPALGPDAYLFHPLESDRARGWPEEHRASARSLLDAMKPGCDGCDGASRFAWIPVEADACLWPEDWLTWVARGELAPAASLCGACAARRLSRSIEERGLWFEAIVPPRAGDGVLFGDEA